MRPDNIFFQILESWIEKLVENRSFFFCENWRNWPGSVSPVFGKPAGEFENFKTFKIKNSKKTRADFKSLKKFEATRSLQNSSK
jgi:hypothetical protein